MIYLRRKNLIKLIEAQNQLIEEYIEKIALLEEQNGWLEKAIRDLVRMQKEQTMTSAHTEKERASDA